jgi:hypothetical protein
LQASPKSIRILLALEPLLVTNTFRALMSRWTYKRSRSRERKI